jgi:hypothetical protein
MRNGEDCWRDFVDIEMRFAHKGSGNDLRKAAYETVRDASRGG